jgi:hypothetical protein
MRKNKTMKKTRKRNNRVTVVKLLLIKVLLSNSYLDISLFSKSIDMGAAQQSQGSFTAAECEQRTLHKIDLECRLRSFSLVSL